MENKKTLNLIGLRVYYWALIINLIGSFGAAILRDVPIWDYLNIASTIFIIIALFLLAKFNSRYLLARNLYIIVLALLAASVVLIVSNVQPILLGEPSPSIYLAVIFSIIASIASICMIFIVMRATAELCADCHAPNLSMRIDDIRVNYGGALVGMIGSIIFILVPIVSFVAIFLLIAASVWMIVLNFRWLGRVSETYETLHGMEIPERISRYMEQ